MYTDKKVIIGAVLGILIGCLFTGIYADKLHRENEMLKSENVMQNERAHRLMKVLSRTEDERDVLSDIIRAYHDEQECEGINADPIYSVAHDILPAIECDTINLGDWSYCY